MNINRDNYEEYFLLYADNELTDSEKVEVIMFLKNNKDLEGEFRMIHHTISKPEVSVQLIDKSFLFKKTTTSFINDKNYEEVFVLYHDNELTENEKLRTVEFLSVHKELKNEFDLIGVARLTPESATVFPNKKILYKKEKSGKVVPIIFWRMIAVAVFIGFGLWITNLYFKKPAEKANVRVQSVPSKNSSPKIEKNILSEKKVTEVVAQSTDQTIKIKEAETDHKKIKRQKFLSQKSNSNEVVKTIISKQKKPEENITIQLPEKINNKDAVAKNEIKNITKDEVLSTQKIEPSKDLVQNNIEKAQPETYAKTASYNVDAENKNQNYVFYDISASQFKKTKVGGFLKKVKRVIERTNPIVRLLKADDRQVVAK
jgi:tellurite resistance protein